MLVSTTVTVAATNKTGPSKYSMGPTDPVTLPSFFSRNNTATSMKMYISPMTVATIASYPTTVTSYPNVYPTMHISSPIVAYTVNVQQPKPVASINKSSPVGFYDITVKENLISKYKKYIPTYTTTSTASVPLNANTTKIMVNGVIDGTAFGTVRNPFTIIDPIALTINVTLGSNQHLSLTNLSAVNGVDVNVTDSRKLTSKQRVEISGQTIFSTNNVVKYTGTTYSPSLSFTFYSRYSLSDADFYYKPIIDTRLLLQKNNDPRYVPLKTLYGIKAGNYYRGGETPPTIQRLI